MYILKTYFGDAVEIDVGQLDRGRGKRFWHFREAFHCANNLKEFRIITLG